MTAAVYGKTLYDLWQTTGHSVYALPVNRRAPAAAGFCVLFTALALSRTPNPEPRIPHQRWNF